MLAPSDTARGGQPEVLPEAGAARFAVHAGDALRRRGLEQALAAGPAEIVPREAAEIDVLVIDLAPSERVPPGAAAQAPLLVLSDDRALAADMTVAGVIPRASTPRQVAAAAAAVAEGLVVRATGAVPERARFAPLDAGPRPLLTPRELEILALVGQGMSNKVIARRLGISAHTVKYHLEAVFAKLDVRSRAEAVSRGLRHGLFEV